MFDEVGTTSEPEEALRQVKHLAGGDPATANEAWYQSMTRLAERLGRMARADEAEGHPLTAARKWHRAGIYHLRAERFLAHTDAREIMSYRRGIDRSEEHTSELQSLMRISYAVFCLKKKNNTIKTSFY